MRVNTHILPIQHEFAKVNASHELNLEAICLFVATGFFLGEDTYWKDEICLSPGSAHEIDENGFRLKSVKDFNWFYEPLEISFNAALDEYIVLLSDIVNEQIKDRDVILPLSGGLDSRSLALILKDVPNHVSAISYSFDGGYPEDKIAERIANTCNFKFQSFKISEGYLWDKIDSAAQVNQCFSEFTNPRQIAVIDKLKNAGDLFLLGHWGDVLFDRGIEATDENKEEEDIVFKKIVKPKGLELANALWEHWNISGAFEDYLRSRIKTELDSIDIAHKSAKVRAFKTKHWAHRWTTTNMQYFGKNHKIAAPYYHDKMCQFICTVPEEFLADRKLQIAHLRKEKKLASIAWQRHRPFSINNYKLNKIPFNLPYRAIQKVKREINKPSQPYIQRNWELQFIGVDNEIKLKKHLDSKYFLKFVDRSIVDSILQGFKKKDAVNYAHPLSMLLTLSIWFNKFHK